MESHHPLNLLLSHYELGAVFYRFFFLESSAYCSPY